MPSPTVLQIAQDTTARALGTERQVEEPKSAALNQKAWVQALLPGPETITVPLSPATHRGSCNHQLHMLGRRVHRREGGCSASQPEREPC